MLAEQYVRTNYDSCDDFFKNYKLNCPAEFNFAFDVVDKLAAESPGKTAIVWCDETGDEALFTFAQLSELSNKAARFFSGLGIGKSDPVMLMLKRRYEFWICLLGLHKLGAIAIPATHLLTTKDIAYRNQAAGTKLIVSVQDTALINSINEAHPESPFLTTKVCLLNKDTPAASLPDGWIDLTAGINECSGAPVERPCGSCPGDDIMLLYFTSGTTGMPKMVAHNFFYPLAHIATAAFWQGVEEDGLHLTVADTGWAKAAWGKIYGQWLCGCAVFVYDYDKFSGDAMLRVVQKYAVTSFCAPPTIYRFMIKQDLSKYDLSALRHVSVAGEPLNPEVYSQFYQATGLKLMECYGQTEATPMLITPLWMEPHPGSMGKPSPHYNIRLVDENGDDVEVGDEGEIVIDVSGGKPVGLFMGYYRDEERTRSVFYDNLYHTGDMAWKDEEGYYWFIGRSDDVIKSSGYRIGPFEVESALMEHPSVLECAITGVPDETRGAIVKATVVLVQGAVASDELASELQNHVKKVTAPYKYPRIIEFVTELPKTISGKIQRMKIRASQPPTDG